MRCNNCLQLIDFSGVSIVVLDDPQGSLVIKCGRCEFSESFGIALIPKQKSPGSMVLSVYEGKNV